MLISILKLRVPQGQDHIPIANAFAKAAKPPITSIHSSRCMLKFSCRHMLKCTHKVRLARCCAFDCLWYDGCYSTVENLHAVQLPATLALTIAKPGQDHTSTKLNLHCITHWLHSGLHLPSCSLVGWLRRWTFFLFCTHSEAHEIGEQLTGFKHILSITA